MEAEVWILLFMAFIATASAIITFVVYRSKTDLYTKPPTDTFSRPSLWPPLLSAVLVFCVCLMVFVLLTNLALREQVRDGTNKLLNSFDELSSETQGLLDSLNEMGFSQCDESTLLAMRRALFDSDYVTDIGFLQQDQLVCTAGAGILDQPVANEMPDFIGPNGIAIQIRQQLPLLLFDDRIISAFDLRKDAFNLVIAYERIADPIASLPSLQWQMVYLDDAQPVHLAGHASLYALRNEIPAYNGGYNSACSLFVPRYCVATQLSPLEFVTSHRFEVTLALLLSLLLAVASHFLVSVLNRARRSTLTRVRGGLKNGHFYWLYQPIVDLETGHWVGCEALARFQDRYGSLAPNIFIPMLRQLQLTWPFTEIMAQRVLTELAAVSILPDSFKVSLNIFPGDIVSGRVVSLPLLPSLQGNRLTVCLEVTEDEYLDAPAAHASLLHLSQKGFVISLDDFGSGYSNLKDLVNIQFDQLKIDRSFVMDIETNGLKTSLIPHIVELARRFGCHTVAEGIETAEQEQILRAAGVQLGQGWRYGKPMSAKALAQAYPVKPTA